MFCQKCGMKAEDGYRFCQRCGAQLNSFNSSQTPKPKEATPEVPPSKKIPLWQRLLGGRHPSIGVSLLMILAGLIICGIGYSLMDSSTVLHYLNMRDSEYAKIYGHVGMTQGQWIMAIFGTIIDVFGIAMAYIGVVASLDNVKPANRQNSIVAKFIAIALCVVVFFVAIVIRCVLLDNGKGRMSIWDYLILCAIWRAIWRGIVGVKTPNKGSSK